MTGVSARVRAQPDAPHARPATAGRAVTTGSPSAFHDPTRQRGRPSAGRRDRCCDAADPGQGRARHGHGRRRGRRRRRHDAVRRPARRRRHLAGRPGRDDPRPDRTVGRGQDDDHPASHGGPDPDIRHGPGAGRGAAQVPAPDPRAARLHAPVVHALPGPDGPRERRLRGVAVRDDVPAPAAPDPRGPPAARPVGRPEPASRATVRRHAAPARARVRARPRSRPAVPRRADGRDRPAAAGERLGGAPPVARGRPDDAGHDPVHQRGRVVRPRGADRGWPPPRPGDPGRPAARGVGRRRHRDRDRRAVRRRPPRGPAVRPRRAPDRSTASHGHRRRCRTGHARRGRRDPGARRRGRERPRGATHIRRGLHGARRTGPGRARPG